MEFCKDVSWNCKQVSLNGWNQKIWPQQEWAIMSRGRMYITQSRDETKCLIRLLKQQMIFSLEIS
jgi:hypothetical protein